MSRPSFIATGSQTIGPFFHVGPGGTDRFRIMAGPDTPGERLQLRVRVLDGDGAPVPDAMIELWQADASGAYSAPPGSGETNLPAFTGFGRVGTDEDGWCTFETIRPGAVDGGVHHKQAAHINVCLFARGLLRHVYTRIYFEDDPALPTDPLLSVVPRGRVPTLLARRSSPDAPSTWEFVIRLQGGDDDETLFFDV